MTPAQPCTATDLHLQHVKQLLKANKINKPLKRKANDLNGHVTKENTQWPVATQKMIQH